jgi:hypothetical protein
MVVREVMYLTFNDLEPGSTEANQPSLTYPDMLIYPGAASYLHAQNQIAWVVAPPKKLNPWNSYAQDAAEWEQLAPTQRVRLPSQPKTSPT